MTLLSIYLKPTLRKLTAYLLFVIVALMLYNTVSMGVGLRAGYVEYNLGYPLKYAEYDSFYIRTGDCPGLCIEHAAYYTFENLLIDLIFWYLVAAFIVEVCNIPCTLAKQNKLKRNKLKKNTPKKSKRSSKNRNKT